MIACQLACFLRIYLFIHLFAYLLQLIFHLVAVGEIGILCGKFVILGSALFHIRRFCALC